MLHFDPTGDVAVLGGHNCLSTCSFNTQAGMWELSNIKKRKSESKTCIMLIRSLRLQPSSHVDWSLDTETWTLLLCTCTYSNVAKLQLQVNNLYSLIAVK